MPWSLLICLVGASLAKGGPYLSLLVDGCQHDYLTDTPPRPCGLSHAGTHTRNADQGQPATTLSTAPRLNRELNKTLKDVSGDAPHAAPAHHRRRNPKIPDGVGDVVLAGQLASSASQGTTLAVSPGTLVGHPPPARGEAPPGGWRRLGLVGAR